MQNLLGGTCEMWSNATINFQTIVRKSFFYFFPAVLCGNLEKLNEV